MRTDMRTAMLIAVPFLLRHDSTLVKGKRTVLRKGGVAFGSRKCSGRRRWTVWLRYAFGVELGLGEVLRVYLLAGDESIALRPADPCSRRSPRLRLAKVMEVMPRWCRHPVGPTICLCAWKPLHGDGAGDELEDFLIQLASH